MERTLFEKLQALQDMGVPRVMLDRPLQLNKDTHYHVEHCLHRSEKALQTSHSLLDLTPADTCGCINSWLWRLGRTWRCLASLQASQELLERGAKEDTLRGHLSFLTEIVATWRIDTVLATLQTRAVDLGSAPQDIQDLGERLTHQAETVLRQTQGSLRRHQGELWDGSFEYYTPGAPECYLGVEGLHRAGANSFPGILVGIYLTQDPRELVRGQGPTLTTVVQVPQRMAEAFQNRAAFLAATIHYGLPVLPEDGPGVLENVQALWSPRSDGALSHLPDALAAARAL